VGIFAALIDPSATAEHGASNYMCGLIATGELKLKAEELDATRAR
jgi:hypothetical protein